MFLFALTTNCFWLRWCLWVYHYASLTSSKVWRRLPLVWGGMHGQWKQWSPPGNNTYHWCTMPTCQGLEASTIGILPWLGFTGTGLHGQMHEQVCVCGCMCICMCRCMCRCTCRCVSECMCRYMSGCISGCVCTCMCECMGRFMPLVGSEPSPEDYSEWFCGCHS